MDDLRADLSQHVPDSHDRRKVADGSDAPGHLNRMHDHTLLFGKTREKLPRRREPVNVESAVLHIADLPPEKEQRLRHSGDVDELDGWL